MTAPNAKRSLDALRAERDRYVSLAFCCADLLFELDRNFDVLFAAGALGPFFGKSAAQLRSTSFRDLIAPADRPIAAQALKGLPKTGRAHDEQIRIVDRNGNSLWMSMSAYCLDPVEGNIFVGLRKADAAAKATALSYPRDETSGLYDSGSFAELAAERIKKIQAAGEAAEVTLLSMPEIEALQQRLGREQSTSLLHRLGDFLKANSVGGDSAARVAEGKFSIMHAAGAKLGELTGQIEEITRSVDPAGRGARVDAATVALDAAALDGAELTKGLLYLMHKFSDDSAADVHAITANMSRLVDEAAAEVNGFRQIVALSKFHVVLQPIIHATSGEIHHYEALCRFDKNPADSPFKTITFAEETGLIHEFDLAMAKKVVDWLSKRPRNSDRFNVALNVSGFSIGQDSYLDALMKLLKANAWTRGKLMFEITESARMSNLEQANNFIQALRTLGYSVSLDDFGAGAASFQYLSVLEVDLVKLDGSAVKNAQRAAKGRAFLSALTGLCRSMEIGTIAEMIDTPETLTFVRDCGCDFVQGFLFGKPSRDIRHFTPLPRIELFGRTLGMAGASL
ncbi:MAG TPA: EAL domain-containing protein [Stellaceae bacterium]|nr:EAL domain-containing protein [Stellaceae bacterium]